MQTLLETVKGSIRECLQEGRTDASPKGQSAFLEGAALSPLAV